METKNLHLEFLTNAFGYISDEIKQMLLDYLKNPSYRKWDEIHSIIIMDNFRTVWQVICEIDPTFPRTGKSFGEMGKILKDWERIPDSELLLKTLKYAAEKNMKLKLN